MNGQFDKVHRIVNFGVLRERDSSLHDITFFQNSPRRLVIIIMNRTTYVQGTIRSSFLSRKATLFFGRVSSKVIFFNLTVDQCRRMVFISNRALQHRNNTSVHYFIFVVRHRDNVRSQSSRGIIFQVSTVLFGDHSMRFKVIKRSLR